MPVGECRPEIPGNKQTGGGVVGYSLGAGVWDRPKHQCARPQRGQRLVLPTVCLNDSINRMRRALVLCCLFLLPSQCWGSPGDFLEKDCIAPHMGKDTLYLKTIQMPLWALKLENFTELDKKIDASIR